MRSAARVCLWAVIAALIVVCIGVASADAAKKPSKKPRFSIAVLSGRADLVSGGSALVAIALPRADARSVEVTLGNRNVRRAFSFRPDGQFEGLVTGLALGRNVLRATLSSGWATELTLVNHPLGGA